MIVPRRGALFSFRFIAEDPDLCQTLARRDPQDEDIRLDALFRSRLPDLVKYHPGQWAVVDDAGNVDTDVDKASLLNKHHPGNPHYFIIRRICATTGR